MSEFRSRTTPTGKRAEYKVIICGDGAVGKTTLLHRHLKGVFMQNVRPTIGVNAVVQEIRPKYEDQDQGVGSISRVADDVTEESFTFWDLGGQTLFSQIRPTYMSGANAIMLVFNTNDDRSFIGSKVDKVDHSIGQFVKELFSALGSELKQIPTLLVGTKCDLDRRIKNAHADFVTRKLKEAGMNIVGWQSDNIHGLRVFGNWSDEDVGEGRYMWDDEQTQHWIATSAKTNENVELAFQIIQQSLREIRKLEYLRVSGRHNR